MCPTKYTREINFFPGWILQIYIKLTRVLFKVLTIFLYYSCDVNKTYLKWASFTLRTIWMVVILITSN